MIKKTTILLISIFMVFSLCAGCSNSKDENVQELTTQKTEEGEKMLKLLVNDKEIPVIWEKNKSVEALGELVSEEAITIEMSMYGDFEQVGSLGNILPSNNQEITTENGDIVLYNSRNIVIFYGSNSWSYTRLGKIDLSAKEVTDLLSNGSVIVTIQR